MAGFGWEVFQPRSLDGMSGGGGPEAPMVADNERGANGLILVNNEMFFTDGEWRGGVGGEPR
jgi:hypothetical protein